ncbi:hypothetical protein K470DRAFT_132679 [Piedraia hortae CBS 480.64]|uniref:Uncharacterized protein n=1 Tax=Piedraia hortae CBS 480.64 TaxID=1314780 RepID=A0A6A7BUL8_9PEZI|nr:hypothetical protein K470DRAFT_132679 [Piedraia hortae CBS 480.64]
MTPTRMARPLNESLPSSPPSPALVTRQNQPVFLWNHEENTPITVFDWHSEEPASPPGCIRRCFHEFHIAHYRCEEHGFLHSYFDLIIRWDDCVEEQVSEIMFFNLTEHNKDRIPGSGVVNDSPEAVRVLWRGGLPLKMYLAWVAESYLETASLVMPWEVEDVIEIMQEWNAFYDQLLSGELSLSDELFFCHDRGKCRGWMNNTSPQKVFVIPTGQ